MTTRAEDLANFMVYSVDTDEMVKLTPKRLDMLLAAEAWFGAISRARKEINPDTSVKAVFESFDDWREENFGPKGQFRDPPFPLTSIVIKTA